MTYTDNFFRILPTPKDKNARRRKYNLVEADLNISEAVNDICNEFFTRQTKEALMDPIKCALVLQQIMTSTPHMENLSDFVAICFVYMYTYKNQIARPQSFGLLRYCIQNEFKFEDQELDLIVKTMMEHPPKNATDMKFCSQIIALICKKSEYCAKFLVRRYKEDKYSPNKAKFLQTISQEISHDAKNFTEDDLQVLNAELRIDQSLKDEPEEKKTPKGEEIIKKAEKNIKMDSFFSKLRKCDKLLFIILTIIILFLIINLV